nr:hypothetical protein CFP56_20627 [Quercus suber]
MRALRKCPVKKLVIIGVSSPIGNTWGLAGQDLPEPLDSHVLVALEAEDKAAIHASAFAELDKTARDSKFSATYGWPSGPPQMHTIASLFSHSITELKFCGHKGAPFLFDPTPITVAMLYPLKHFHKLETLVLSVWLNTHFEGEPRDHEIIDYWMDARTPTSTALVHITDDEPQGWERQLWTKFSPHALAWRVTSFIGMYLSDEAKQRPGGVNVRATFCLGHWGGIFDIDVRVGYSALGSKLLGYKGPSEELEPQRRREKLESRRWF